MKRTLFAAVALLLVFSSLPAAGAAELKLAGVFVDHAVVQCDKALPVWGSADAGAEVAVEFAGQKKTTTADAGGKWLMKLDPVPASAEPQALVVTAGKNSLQRTDLLVGEVWLCAGGLEVAKGIANLGDAKAIAAEPQSGAAPLVRVFATEVNAAPEPQSDVKGRWLTAGAAPMNPLPAEALYVGRKLAADLGVPVGIVQAAMGYPGQPIETWMSRETLAALPAAEPILAYFVSDQWKLRSAGTYEERLKAWLEYCQKLPLNPPPKPKPNEEKAAARQQPSVVWNAMIAPLAPLAIRGVVWDHGEDDGSMQRAVQYGQLLPAMIASWRQAFGLSELPFVVVQHRARNDSFPHGGRDGRLAAELRDAQRAGAAAAKAALVVTIDLGADPHPRDVGPRIANAILNRFYGKQGIGAAGPELAEVETAGDKVILHFRNTEGGLVAKNGDSKAAELKGFAIASSLFRWVWADAVIEGDTIIVSAPTVDKPQGVRYAWQDLPSQGANLYNGAGSPASPFRTDTHLLCSANAVKPSDRMGFNRRADLGMENPRLPRVLIIGDSISGHYLEEVRDGLRDRANVIGESSMLKGTWASMGPRFYRADWAARGSELKQFLADRGPFDVVHFNNGIHNFAGAKPGDEVPYAANLRKAVAAIRESGAICLFANSTGTVADNRIPTAPHYLTNCRAFNAAAEAVMRELNVPVTDIYGAIQPRIEELISQDLIHPKDEAAGIMAKLIIERIDEALKTLPPRANR